MTTIALIADGTYLAESDGMGGVQATTRVFMGKGYFVAEFGGVEVNGLDERAMKDALYLMDIEPGEHIGVWTDEVSGMTYVERAHYIVKKRTAIELGLYWNQSFIYDCANKELIDLGDYSHLG